VSCRGKAPSSLLLSDYEGHKAVRIREVYSPVNQSLKLVTLKGEVIERRYCGNEYYSLRIKQLLRTVWI